jgi:hypothetical protein
MMKHLLLCFVLFCSLTQCNYLINRNIPNSKKVKQVANETSVFKKDTVIDHQPTVAPPEKIYLRSLLVIDSTEFYVGANDGYLLHFKNNSCHLEKLSAKKNEVGSIEQMHLDSAGTILILSDHKIWKKKDMFISLLDADFQTDVRNFIRDNKSDLYICNQKEIHKYTKAGWQKINLPLTNHKYEYFGTLKELRLLAVTTEKMGRARGATSEIHIFKDSCWNSYKSAPFYSVNRFFGNPEINDIYAVGQRFKTIPDTLNDSYFMQFVQPILFFDGSEWVDFKDDSYFVGDIIHVDYKGEKHFDIYKSDGNVFSFNNGQWDTICIDKTPYTLSSLKLCIEPYGSKMLTISSSEVSIYEGNSWKVFFNVKELYQK